MNFTVLHNTIQYCVSLHYCITLPLMGESNILNTIDVQQGIKRMYSGVTTKYSTARRFQPWCPMF